MCEGRGRSLIHTHIQLLAHTHTHTHKGYKHACNERKGTMETMWLFKGKCKDEDTHVHAAMCRLHAAVRSYVQLRLCDWTVLHLHT